MQWQWSISLGKSNSIYLFAHLTSFCSCQETICCSSLLWEQRLPCGLDWKVEKPSLIQEMEKLSWTGCLLNHCCAIRSWAHFWNTFLDLIRVTIEKKEGKGDEEETEGRNLTQSSLGYKHLYSEEHRAINFIPITFKLHIQSRVCLTVIGC